MPTPTFEELKHWAEQYVALWNAGDKGRWCMNRGTATAAPHPGISQAPIAKDSGLPRAVIRLRMLQAMIASACCDSGFRARSL